MSLQLPHEKNAKHGCITVSVGVAVFDSQSIELEAEVFERADEALYVAKTSGRNVTVVAPTFNTPDGRRCA